MLVTAGDWNRVALSRDWQGPGGKLLRPKRHISPRYPGRGQAEQAAPASQSSSKDCAFCDGG